MVLARHGKPSRGVGTSADTRVEAFHVRWNRRGPQTGLVCRLGSSEGCASALIEPLSQWSMREWARRGGARIVMSIFREEIIECTRGVRSMYTCFGAARLMNQRDERVALVVMRRGGAGGVRLQQLAPSCAGSG
jgi:hypothetical protein